MHHQLTNQLTTHGKLMELLYSRQLVLVVASYSTISNYIYNYAS